MPGPVVSRKLHFLGDFCGRSRAPPLLRGVGGLVCRGGIYAAREVWAGWSVGAAYMPPARLPRYAVYGMICREGVLPPPRYPKTNRTNTKKARPPLPGGRAECANVAYSAWIAPVGQTPSQAPQSTQVAASTTALSSMVIAPTGQVSTHAPQATHSLETV